MRPFRRPSPRKVGLMSVGLVGFVWMVGPMTLHLRPSTQRRARACTPPTNPRTDEVGDGVLEVVEEDHAVQLGVVEVVAGGVVVKGSSVGELLALGQVPRLRPHISVMHPRRHLSWRDVHWNKLRWTSFHLRRMTGRTCGCENLAMRVLLVLLVRQFIYVVPRRSAPPTLFTTI